MSSQDVSVPKESFSEDSKKVPDDSDSDLNTDSDSEYEWESDDPVWSDSDSDSDGEKTRHPNIPKHGFFVPDHPLARMCEGALMAHVHKAPPKEPLTPSVPSAISAISATSAPSATGGE